MKNKIRLASKLLFSDKKSIVNIIITGFIISLTVVISCYYSTTNNYMKNGIKNNWLYRTLYVTINNSNSIEENKEIIESNDNVLAVFKEYSYQNGIEIDDFSNDDLDGSIWLYAATEKTIPKIVVGSYFPDDDDNYMICPVNFYPGVSEETLKYIGRHAKIDLTNLIGREISYNYESTVYGNEYTLTYKLVGLYENNSTVVDENVCYVNEKSLEEFYFNLYNEESDFDINLYNSFIIVVNEYQNVDDVKATLKEQGYSVENTTWISSNVLDIVSKNTIAFTIIIYLTSIVFVIVVLIKQFRDDTKFYKILYCIGYKNSDISQIYFINCFLRIFLSFLIVLLFSLLIKLGINILLYFKPFIFHKWKIVIDYSYPSILFALIMFIMITITIYFSSNIMSKGDEVQ